MTTNPTRTLQSTVRKRREEDLWPKTGRRPPPLSCALINSSLANLNGEKGDGEGGGGGGERGGGGEFGKKIFFFFLNATDHFEQFSSFFLHHYIFFKKLIILTDGGYPPPRPWKIL